MQIKESFIQNILQEEYVDCYQNMYDNSLLIQYLDIKMGAVHGNSKTRRSLANIYAIYAILKFYSEDFFEKPEAYRNFEGYEFTKLFNFFRGLYGGEKLQNHALNSRVNGEFKNKFPNITTDLFIIDSGKYLINIAYLYVLKKDISRIVCRIIEKYIELLVVKDSSFLQMLKEMEQVTSASEKMEKLLQLLSEETEARIFEIITYSILKNHYKNIKVYFGYDRDDVKEVNLELFRTGRTNANDGGIDFVMRPTGRFFQVTEVNNYDKYLLDIDKILHYPISFVVKTTQSRQTVMKEIEKYIDRRTNGMVVLEKRYRNAIEEIITINELRDWIFELGKLEIDNLIHDIDVYYRLEMNLNK